MHILAVDDDLICREMLAALLTDTGIGGKVTSVDSAEAAMEVIERARVDLVVTDWCMPGMNGLELCRRIRQRGAGHYVYLIVITEASGSALEALTAEADDFIRKPFDPSELQARVRAGQRVLALQSREVTIFALAKLAESRDPETGAHLERIQTYCQLLASELHRRRTFPETITPDFIELIYLTSPLHDVGKIGIPDCVLLKPGQLSAEEYRIIQTHAEIGANAIGEALAQYPAASYLKMGYEIALMHHERWNGKGYPQGLVGEAIPVAARIMALADVYDALTSVRCYKEAISHTVASSMIREEAGKHFDPRIVEAFESVADAFAEYRCAVDTQASAAVAVAA